MDSKLQLLFSSGAILSLKTLAQRSQYARKKTKYQIQKMIDNKFIRKCQPNEVGSGKHHCMLFTMM